MYKVDGDSYLQLLDRAIQHDPEVARYATHLSISGNMIKQKTCKFCVDNWKTNVFLKINENNSGNQEIIRATQFSTMGGRPMNLGLSTALKESHP